MTDAIRTYAANALHAAKIAVENIASDEEYQDGVDDAKAICNRINALCIDLGAVAPSGNRWVSGGPQGLHDASMQLVIVRGHLLELERTHETVRLANEANNIRGDIIAWYEDYA